MNNGRGRSADTRKRELSGKRSTRRLRASSPLCYCVHLGTTGRFGLVVREERGCGQTMGDTVTERKRIIRAVRTVRVVRLCGAPVSQWTCETSCRLALGEVMNTDSSK